MTENPYEAPYATNDAPNVARNRIGGLGFFLSLIGLTGLAIAGPFGPTVSLIGMWLAFLCLPGLLMSLIGVFHKPRRLAVCGIALGIFGSLNLPTYYLAVFIAPYR